MMKRRTLPIRTAAVAGIATLLITLGGCQGLGLGGFGGGSGDSEGTGGDDTSAQSPTTTPSEEPDDDDDDAGGAREAGGSGSADADGDTVNYVIVGDARYGADTVQCKLNDGGLEVVGQVTHFSANGVGGTPQESIQIGAVFGVGSAEDPPDTVFVLLEAGDGGQWSAMTEVQGFSLGSLSNVSYGIGEGASGDARFALHSPGSGVPDNTAPGEFNFECP